MSGGHEKKHGGDASGPSAEAARFIFMAAVGAAATWLDEEVPEMIDKPKSHGKSH